MAEKTRARTVNTSAIRFDAQLRQIARRTILRLPDDASAKLPSRGQVAVKGVMNRHGFQTVLEPDGRRGHWLKVDKKLRQVLAVGEGDTVVVEVEPARHLRVVEGHHTNGALGMGALDTGDEEPRNSEAARPTWHLETAIW